MQRINSTGDVRQLGTILFIGAHPDDETFAAGGLLAAAIRNGQKVVVVTATKGEGGIQDTHRWPAEHLGDIRMGELKHALEILGCKYHYWLDYQDGRCATDSGERAITRIKQIIEEHQPHTILTFGPDGLTGHPDHQTVSAWASAANDGKAHIYHVVEEQAGYEKHMSKADKQFNWYFNIANPPLKAAADCYIALNLTAELRDIKLRALKAMPSQYEKFFTDVPGDLLENLFTVECFVKAR